MKMEQKLKVILLILLIVLMCFISIGGVWIQNKGRMQNLVNNYILGRDLAGGRHITLEIKEDKKIEAEGKEETEKAEESQEDKELNKEDFIRAKNIIEKRLSNMKVEDYIISLDEKTGLINLQIPENEYTDYIIEYSTLKGKFTIEDESGNVLLDTSNIKKVKTMYGQVSTTSEQGLKVFLRIQFNDDCIDKLKEISTTYVASKDEKGNDTSKKVNIKLDGSKLSTTSFDKEITEGYIELAVGNTTNSSEELQSYLQQASYLEKIFNYGELPANYEITINNYVLSDITEDMQMIGMIIIAAIILAIIIYLIVKYHKNGIIVSLSSIGYIAVLLFVIRYTNVVVTIDGVIGILISIFINYILNLFILKKLINSDNTKNEMESNINKGIIKGLLSVVPMGLIAIVLCFSKWSLIYSFGMISFWGIIIMIIYNIVITKNLLLNFRKD